MQALYRKYRPTRLEDVIGQDQVKNTLQSAISSGKFSHAYLFIGPRGCGKTSVARIFAHEINGFDYQVEDSYVDIIEIDAASNTGVDNIRELREKAIIAPTEGKYKVYIIDEVHMLSKAAFNALLKTLEEPPTGVVFIMATTDAHKIPATITSRTQVFNFHLATPDVMQKHLQKIAKQEKIAITDDALSLIVERGGGSFRDSISLLDQISALEGPEITYDAVLSALGLPGQSQIDGLLAAYREGNTAKITQILQDYLNSGKKPEILAENLIATIMTRPEPILLSLLEKLPEVKTPFPEAKLLLAFLGDLAQKPVPQVVASAPVAENATPVSATSNSANMQNTEGRNQHSESSSANSAQTPSFSWQNFVETISDANSALGAMLKKCRNQIKNGILHLYPERKTYAIVLGSKNNRTILEKNLPAGLSLEIHEAGEKMQEDQKISAISDIMGEVTEVNSDGIPFDQ